MIGLEFKHTGNLDRDLDRFAEKVQGEVLISGVAAMARVIYDEVRLNAEKHVQTGLLLSAVYRVYVKERSTDTQKIYRVSVNKAKAPHWHFLEYGTSRQKAQPFIRPTFDHIGRAVEAGKTRMSERMGEIEVGGDL